MHLTKKSYHQSLESHFLYDVSYFHCLFSKHLSNEPCLLFSVFLAFDAESVMCLSHTEIYTSGISLMGNNQSTFY